MILKRYIHNTQADAASANYNLFRPQRAASGKNSKTCQAVVMQDGFQNGMETDVCL
jgi:hypothetical protein